MKLTPLDIKKQTFRKVMRGVDPEEVRSYLEMLAEDWGGMQDEVRRLREKQREDAVKLEHYTRVEEALQEALRTARESARRAIANAERKAELLVETAEQQADAVKRAAVEERQRILRESKTLATRRDEIAARLRAFLHSELELLTRFDESRRTAPPAAPAPEASAPAVTPTPPSDEPSPEALTAAPASEENQNTDAEALAEVSASPEPSAPEAATPGFRIQPLVTDDAPIASEEQSRQIRALMKELE